MVVIVFFVLVEMMCIQNNREKICWWEKETERILNNAFCRGRDQDGG